MVPNIRIVYRQRDGVVALSTPGKHFPMADDESLEDYVKRFDAYLRKEGAIPADWTLIGSEDPSSIPYSDKTFRSAWVYDNGVKIDFSKACELTKDRLRREREPLFETLDVQYMRAQERGTDTSAIVAEKDRLRDLPTLVDNVPAGDLESLKRLKA